MGECLAKLRNYKKIKSILATRANAVAQLRNYAPKLNDSLLTHRSFKLTVLFCVLCILCCVCVFRRVRVLCVNLHSRH